MVTALVAFPLSAGAQTRWVSTPLGGLSDRDGGRAEDINDAGHIVGSSPTLSYRHAFLWTPENEMVDLGTLGATSEAHAINDAGQVVGYSTMAVGGSGATRAFLWTAAAGMVDLTAPAGSVDSEAFAINNAGWVVGVHGAQASRPHGLQHGAFLWTPTGGMIDLGTLGGQRSLAYDVNDGGQVVGYSAIASQGPRHAFLWTATGGMVDLGTLGGLESVATAVNAAGQVVGYSDTAEGGYHAFLWTAAGGMVDLWAGQEGTSLASDINDLGQIVGYSEIPHVRFAAVAWTPAGRIIRLGTAMTTAEGIGADGTIVGSAHNEFSYGRSQPVRWDQRDDLAFDFGPGSGTWLLIQRGWIQAHGLSPAAMVAGDLDNNGADDLVVDFGPGTGLWAWMNQTDWSFIHHLSPTRMIVADMISDEGGDQIIATFRGFGLWRWVAGTWDRLHPIDGIPLIAGEGSWMYPLVVDFPDYGLWVLTHAFDNSESWLQLHTLRPGAVAFTDLDHDGTLDLLADFPDRGLWVYRNGAWSELSGKNVLHMGVGDVDGNGRVDLVADFGPSYGLWILRDGTAWEQLHQSSSEDLLVADRDWSGEAEVVVDFGPAHGVWQYENDSTWTQLHRLSTESLAVGAFH